MPTMRAPKTTSAGSLSDSVPPSRPSEPPSAWRTPFPSISGVRAGCAPLIRMGPVSRPSVPTRVRIVGSEWTKTEAADEAAATTVARVRCMTRCARTVAKPRRSRLNRTRRGPSIAAIVSQSAGRDGSSQERQQSVRTLFRFELHPVMRLARSSRFSFPSDQRIDSTSAASAARIRTWAAGRRIFLRRGLSSEAHTSRYVITAATSPLWYASHCQ